MIKQVSRKTLYVDLHDFGVRSILLKKTKSTNYKKFNNLDYITNKNFCSSKFTIYRVKRQTEEKIFKIHSLDKRLLSIIFKGLLQIMRGKKGGL